METSLTDRLERAGAVWRTEPAGRAACHFGDAAAEYEAARHHVAVFDLSLASKVRGAGPEGPPIEMASVQKEQLPSELSKVLHRLIEKGDLAAKDVVVLTPHTPAHSPVLGQVGAFKLTDDPIGKRDVRLSSIFRYKGLDAPAIVICDVDRFVEEEFTKLMYVACSRARAYLAVLLND